MKRVVFVIKLMFVTIMLGACTKGNRIMANMLSPLENIWNLDIGILNNAEKETLEAFQGDLSELNDLLPIKCLRKTAEGYSAIYAIDEAIEILFFDEEGQFIGKTKQKWSAPKKVFDTIQKGDSLDRIMSIDPNGNYLFLNTGHNEPMNSFHYTEDGYYIVIKYEFNEAIKMMLAVQVSIDLI